MSNWIKKKKKNQEAILCCLQETHLKHKESDRLIVNKDTRLTNQKKAGVATLV